MKTLLTLLTCLFILFGRIGPSFARYHRDAPMDGIPWVVYLIVGAVIYYFIKHIFRDRDKD